MLTMIAFAQRYPTLDAIPAGIGRWIHDRLAAERSALAGILPELRHLAGSAGALAQRIAMVGP
jgi:hypothetical protein